MATCQSVSEPCGEINKVSVIIIVFKSLNRTPSLILHNSSSDSSHTSVLDIKNRPEFMWFYDTSLSHDGICISCQEGHVCATGSQLDALILLQAAECCCECRVSV